MKILAYLRSLAAKFFRRSQVEDDIEEELRAHIQHHADDLERSGLSRTEAERQARIRLGGQLRFREECREALGGNFIETLVQDLRYGIRVLRKSRGFTIVSIFTLALAICANAVVFGVINSLLLRQLNVPHPESLYALEFAKNNSTTSLSYPDYLDLRDRNKTFDGLIAYNIDTVGLDTGGNPTRTWIEDVSGNYFDALEIQPYLGQFFHASDERGPNSIPSIVLTYAYWHTHFQDDRGAIGRVIQVNKHPFTIIGVTPPDFRGTIAFFNPEAYVPIVDQGEVYGSSSLDDRGNRSLQVVIGHLRPGITPAQATADLDSIGSYLETTYPKDHSQNGQMRFVLTSPALGGSDNAPFIAAFLSGLMLLAGLILLAACANLGSLFAARAADRSREIALRLALGGGRLRILRQLFTEAILISLIGGVVGLWGTIVLLNELSAWRPAPRYPLYVPVNPDARVYAIALLLALVSGLLFGAVPVRQILHTNPYEVIKSASTGKVNRRLSIRDWLLIGQIAICAVLITASLVAVRGLMRSLHGNFGFEPDNSIVADADLTMAGYSIDRVPEMQKRIVDAVAALPGVDAAGFSNELPLEFPNNAPVFKDNTPDLIPANVAATAEFFKVSPGYFQAAGTKLLLGRNFTSHDDKAAPRVAVVNQEFARKIFGTTANSINQYYKTEDGTRVQVVGIVEDGKYESLTEESKPAMFLPILQWPTAGAYLVVRSSSRDLQELATTVRNNLRGLDPSLPVVIQTRYKSMDAILLGPRMATISLGVLGLLGAMLAITGVFGMAAYSVSKRLKEFGIRMALGAQRKDLLSAALGRAFKLLAIGSGAGLVLGLLASSVLGSIVYQATPRDPLVLIGSVLAMSLLGLLATWIPARQALSVDPMTLLRDE